MQPKPLLGTSVNFGRFVSEGPKSKPKLLPRNDPSSVTKQIKQPVVYM